MSVLTQMPGTTLFLNHTFQNDLTGVKELIQHGFARRANVV
jgi:hypothetical protein